MAIKNNTLTNQRISKRLGDFGDVITQNAFDDYLLIEESFNPLNLISDSAVYTKQIIYEVHQ